MNEITNNAPVPEPQPQDHFELILALCAVKDDPTWIVKIKEKFAEFEKDPDRRASGVFREINAMSNDEHLMYKLKSKDVVWACFTAGLMLGSAINQPGEFQNQILEFAKDHQPDPTKIFPLRKRTV